VIKKSAEETVIDDNLAQEQAKQIKLQAWVKALPDIKPLSIAKFIKPISEQIDDEDGDIFELVVHWYRTNLKGQESKESDRAEMPKISITKALKHWEGVRLWQL
jgi:hypothetical protein